MALPQAAEPGSLPSGHAFAATTFRALGTYIYVAVRDPRELSRAEQLSRDLLADIDETCSRIRDDSDLTLVNAHAGSWVAADPLLVAGVRVALDAATLTDGLVNPLVGKSLSFWGYDRDFESLVAQPTPVGAASETALDPDAWRRIELTDDAVRIPAGTSLDLGATAKAWAADLIVRAWAEHLDHGALVSLGGDLAILGDGEPWPIAVSERPAEPAQQEVSLDRGGLATSSMVVRRWRRGDTVAHHVIDPRTGRPAAGPWRTATATGATATAANTATTAALILGVEAEAWLARHGIDARLVDHQGVAHAVGDWPIPPLTTDPGTTDPGTADQAATDPATFDPATFDPATPERQTGATR